MLNSNAGSFLNCGGTLIETIPCRPLETLWLIACSATCGLGTVFETVIFPSVTLRTIAGQEISSNATCQSPTSHRCGQKGCKIRQPISGKRFHGFIGNQVKRQIIIATTDHVVRRGVHSMNYILAVDQKKRF